MKNFLLAVLCATSTTSFADSKVFEGLAIDLSAGYQKTERDSASTGTLNGKVDGTLSSSNDDSNANVMLGASYNFAINNNYLLGVGFDYDFADHNMGRTIIDNDPSNDSTKWELNDAMSIYLKPQLMLTDKSQVYVKLAYIKADVKIIDRTPEFVSANSESVDGYSIGAGYANMITNNVSFFVEVNYLKYGEEDVSSNYVEAGYRQTLSLPADIDAYNAKIGIAYKF